MALTSVEFFEPLRHVSKKGARVFWQTHLEQGLRGRSRAVEVQELEAFLKISVDRCLIGSGAFKIGSAALRISLDERPFRLLHQADERFEFEARISFEFVELFGCQRLAFKIATVFFAAHDRRELFVGDNQPLRHASNGPDPTTIVEKPERVLDFDFFAIVEVLL